MDWEHAKISSDFNPGLTEPEAPDQSYHILISDGEILCVDGQHRWRPLTGDEFQWCGLDAISSHYLGDLIGTPVYAVEVDPDADEPSGYGFQSLWSFLTSVEQPVFYLIGRTP
jgi:hypothetical protein